MFYQQEKKQVNRRETKRVITKNMIETVQVSIIQVEMRNTGKYYPTMNEKDAYYSKTKRSVVTVNQIQVIVK